MCTSMHFCNQLNWLLIVLVRHIKRESACVTGVNMSRGGGQTAETRWMKDTEETQSLTHLAAAATMEVQQPRWRCISKRSKDVFTILCLKTAFNHSFNCRDYFSLTGYYSVFKLLQLSNTY